MSTPSAKRRRLDTISATLSRPFRSPFKTPLKPNDEINNKNLSTSTSRIDNNTSTPSKATSTPGLTPHHRSLRPFSVIGSKTPTPYSSRMKGGGIGIGIGTGGFKSGLTSSDPEITALLKEQRLIEQEITKMKNDVEMLRQAKKIEETRSDDELENLIRKWKIASRAAAEEVFADVRETVNRMGGPKAWKDMQLKRNEWRNTGFDEPDMKKNNNNNDDGEEGEIDKRDLYAEYDVDPDPTAEEESMKRDEKEEEEDVFTMDMMLKSLNIELEVIGFDKSLQRWTDD
ncbi:MAG: hypothetical protein M1823_004777 [Watsoniomyces obsoletus]|nr:MAG: hypothetical protein M1823_004777 [Watsoniomyces obsoletus]